MTESSDVERLEARLERERRARRQAEAIAERGMRELWETNRELQLRIDARTGQLERELAALSIVHRRAVAVFAPALEGLVERAEAGDATEFGSVVDTLRWLAGSALVTPTPDEVGPVSLAPITVADEFLARWQRIAARSGQLLSVEADEADADLTLRWDRVVAAVDIALASINRHGPAGAVTVAFNALVSGTARWLRVVLHHGGLTAGDGEASSSTDHDAYRGLGAVGPGLAMAAELAELGGGALHVTTGDIGLTVAATFPAA